MPGKLRVLHLIDTWGPGGAETVCVEIARGLDPERFESVAVVPREGWVHDQMRGCCDDVRIMPFARSADPGYVWRLARLLRRERIDVVQTHLLTSSMYAGLASALTGVPVVSTFHGFVDVKASERLAGLKLWLVGALARRIVFVSDQLRASFLAASSLPAAKSVRIHNGVDHHRVRPVRDAALRRELGIADGTFLVAAIGNVRTAKAYDVLLDAAARLRAAGRDVRFVVAGHAYGELEQRIMAQHRALGLEDTVTFLGFRPDVTPVLRAADAFVLTSRSEGFSIATVEAMCAGVPAVATRCGGPEEIVEDGVTGLLVPVDDPDAVGAALGALADDPALRARLAAAARTRAVERFSVDAMVARYAGLYTELARRGAAARPAAAVAAAAPVSG